MQPPAIFDRTLRRIRRDRAAGIGPAFFSRLLADELLDRLGDVSRPFTHALDLGCGDGTLGRALAARGIAVTSVDAGRRFADAAGGSQMDEDRLTIAPESVDLVISAGGLDQVDDLPGALLQARRALRPDGLFLAAFFGAGSLATLRRAMAAADAEGPAAPRFHPAIDVRAAGDLLSRAGFTMPVADIVDFDLRYPHLFALVADLRAAAATNLLVERARTGLGRLAVARAAAEFAAAADADGRTRERLRAIVLTGWSPADSQPKPARPGSATASLAATLGAGRSPAGPPKG